MSNKVKCYFKVRCYFLSCAYRIGFVSFILLINSEICASAQTAITDLSFEMATITPVVMDDSHPFDPMHFWAHVHPASASYWSMTLEDLITYAFRVQQFQVAGPGWVNADRFDVEARFPEGVGPKDERRMLQALLKDRFKLTFHIEKRNVDGYALVVGKHGEKLTPAFPDPSETRKGNLPGAGVSTAGEHHPPSDIVRNPDGSSIIDKGKRGTQTVKFDEDSWSIRYAFSKMTMGELAGKLSGCLSTGVRKVENQTGIEGNYQVSYDCPLKTPRPTLEGNAPDTVPSDPQDGSSLTRSLDALGLKLERRKVLLDLYVIDDAQKPSGS